ncbi:TetR/AcrR family transcriptional regulator [Solirubrobacter sp. CPCC 204708]|uniref:TetR/AcrR family transcriptional regulator n=1 Tax=Solirubrobacter deserti TaxID=2282478 RepID=A0ABT4RT04_9ACTN|nr:TetR/AcrR family transcriptional regulator [Solirubrobacter deserti]MBE2315097.1 TetR/AcrR family transcriptional regulator [Solirubrobacter deserti]MDA0141381.1 TetR/AcrR family transcriptional regulator [Solirubrobacter deserti]
MPSDLRTRIVDAAARLLQEHGLAAVTTRGVAEAAGVQAPAIYRLFGDKDGLLDAVAERAFARYVDAKALADETDDPVADLRAAWDHHIRFGLTHPALFAILADPGRPPSPVAAAGLEILRGRVHRIAVAGRLQLPEHRVVELIHAAGTGAILTLLATPEDTRDPLLAELLFDAVMCTALTDAPAAAGDHTAAAAVALHAAAPELPGFSAAERTLLAEWLERIGGYLPSSAACPSATVNFFS